MAYHTYEFYRKRKNDPKWRDEYINARNIRIITSLITLVILVFGLLFYFYVKSNNVSLDNISAETFTGFISYISDNFKNMFSFEKERLTQQLN